MELNADLFLASSLPVGKNVVKNILFRASTIVLHFVIYRLLSWVAFKMQDYTSYLMFAEDLVQKGHYIVSRRFDQKALLVLIFAAFTAAAGFYDTLLWALDFPGFVTVTKSVNAGQLSSSLVDSPSYITFLSNPLNDLSRININETFGANLYATGLNFTLSGVIEPGNPLVVPPNQNLSLLVSPRIWLDSEGFAVGIDDLIMITPSMNTTDTFCATTTVNPNQQVWRCNIRNSDALDLLAQTMGRPQIFWDTLTPEHAEFLKPDRKDNPWLSIGSGGGTAVMRQVFTVTKGTTRHTFLQTTFKTTMVSYAPSMFQDAELTGMVRRTWSDGPDQPLTPAVQTLADFVIAANKNQTSLTFGSFLQDNYSVSSVSTELLSVPSASVGATSGTLYTFFRFASTNITLLRSESLFNPPRHIATCDAAYSTFATGGVVHSQNCAISLQNQTGAHFFGQIDASSVVIMSDILGDGTSNTSSKALDAAGITWYNANTDRIDGLLRSRGLILGGARADVQVTVHHDEVAMSYLQLLLTLLPFFLALCLLLFTFRTHMSYFRNSFLSAIVVTTHASHESNCEKLGYVKTPPEILLKRSGEHIVLGTDGADFSLAPISNHLLGYGMSYEPLFMDKEPVGTP